MTDEEIQRSKSDHLMWRFRLRWMVREGTPSRIGSIGGKWVIDWSTGTIIKRQSRKPWRRK